MREFLCIAMQMTDDEFDVEILKNTFKETSPKRGTGTAGSRKKANIPVYFKKDIDTTKVIGSLPDTEEDEFPKLVIFLYEGIFDMAMIVADKEIIHLQANDIGMAIFMYVGVFYVFDQEYPSGMVQWFRFLEATFLKVHKKVEGQGYTALYKKFKEKMIDLEALKDY